MLKSLALVGITLVAAGEVHDAAAEVDREMDQMNPGDDLKNLMESARTLDMNSVYSQVEEAVGMHHRMLSGEITEEDIQHAERHLAEALPADLVDPALSGDVMRGLMQVMMAPDKMKAARELAPTVFTKDRILKVEDFIARHLHVSKESIDMARQMAMATPMVKSWMQRRLADEDDEEDEERKAADEDDEEDEERKAESSSDDESRKAESDSSEAV